MAQPKATYAEVAKNAAAKEAAQIIRDDMLVGIGTGSTATYFIEHLAKRVQEGLNITAVATSKKSEELAAKEGIKIVDLNAVSSLDLTIDGADEVDREKRLIKGRGGALLREKLIASSSYQMFVIVDNSKLVEKVGGKCPLPIEVLPFGHTHTRAKIDNLGFTGDFRKTDNNEFYMTDNGNYIYDATFKIPPDIPEDIDELLHDTPGVLETGFFFYLASRVIVGYPDGHTENH